MDGRYSRQTMLTEIGENGQRRLAEARVLVVGVGGLGSAAAIYLAGAGVGTIGLCDPDTVSLSNLQRQVLYTTAQLGMQKTDCAAERLTALNPDVAVIKIDAPLTPDNASGIVAGYGLVLDCTDNFAVRFAIDDACAEAGIPWVHGAIGAFDGQVALFNGPSGVRYSDLYPDRDALCSAPKRTAGVVGAVPGVIGALQAMQAIKYIAGFGDILDGRLFTISLSTLNTNYIEI